MLFKKFRMILLMAVGICTLSGCSGEAISLEEALLAGTNPQILEEESDMEQIVHDSMTEAAVVYVYICGAVHEPGVYMLPQGSRIIAAIEAAGGFLPEAATEAVNLAQLVSDGMQIVVPDVTEYEGILTEQAQKQKGLINLNTASTEDLCSLKGIGETRAQAILSYREEIGGFRSIEQLKEVSGIGDSLFNQIKQNIYIE